MEYLSNSNLYHYTTPESQGNDPWAGINLGRLLDFELEDEQELQSSQKTQDYVASSEKCNAFFKETMEEGMLATTNESELLNQGAMNSEGEIGDRFFDENLLKNNIHAYVSTRFSARSHPGIHHTFRIREVLIHSFLASLSINEEINEGGGEKDEFIIEIQKSRTKITAYSLSKENIRALYEKIQKSGGRKLSISTAEKMVDYLTGKIPFNPEVNVITTILKLPFFVTTLNGDTSLNKAKMSGGFCDLRMSNVRHLMDHQTTRIKINTLDSKVLTPEDIHSEGSKNDDYALEIQLHGRRDGKTRIRRFFINEGLFEALYEEMNLYCKFKLSFEAMVARLSGHSFTPPSLPEPIQTSTSSSSDLPKTLAMSLPQVGQKHPLSVASLLHSKRQRIDNAPAIGGISITLADKLRELTIHQSTLNGKGLSDDLQRLGRKKLENGYMIIRVSQVMFPDNDYAFIANGNYLSSSSGLRPEDIQVQQDTMEDYVIEFVEKKRGIGFRDLHIGRFYLPPDSFRKFYNNMYNATHKKNLLFEELLIRLSSSK